MPTKTIPKPLTPAQIQRALEAKYKVTPSPWWVDICGQDVRIDGIRRNLD